MHARLNLRLYCAIRNAHHDIALNFAFSICDQVLTLGYPSDWLGKVL